MKVLSKYCISFLFLLALFSCRNDTKPAPKAVKGKIDLSEYSFDQYSTVEVDLVGEWEFYWKELLSPKDFEKTASQPMFVPVPSLWSNYEKEGKNLPVEGYATYRLAIRLDDSPFDSLGLEIPRIWTVSKIWVNGQLVHQQGKVGTTANNYENNMVGLIIPVKAVNHKIELVVQVANFNFFLGGMMENFKFSTYKNIHVESELQSSWGIMWIGVLVIMAVYHLVLFFFRRDSSSTLWFSLICLLIGLRYINFGHHYFYQYLHLHASWYSAAIQVKIYYITQFLLAPVGLLYVHSLYPKRLAVKLGKFSLVQISVIITLVYCLFSVFVPLPVFIKTIIPYQLLFFIFIAYLIVGIIWATLKKEDETRFQLAGILTMILAGINDVLHIFDIHILGDVEILPAAFGVFLLLQVFAIARRFSRSFKETKEFARTLEEKVKKRTVALEAKSEKLQAQSLVVNKANRLLAKKNKDITDSVRYASRIQKAILADLNFVTSEFEDAFVFFQPKDILSGDFYWYFKCKDTGAQIIIAADCTGHGVPGAFMTVMTNDFLNEIVTDRGIMKPSQIIEELDKKVRITLQENKTDGLDIAILLIDAKQEKITYAGAKNPLYYVKNGELKQIKATRRSIGGNLKLAKKTKKITFEAHHVKIEKGDTFYIFSDGFQDQFGGERDTKYLTRNFRQFLFQNHTLKMREQKKKLKNELERWQGEKPQTDDILVIGLKF